MPRAPKGWKPRASTVEAVQTNEHLTYFGAKEDGTSFEDAKKGALRRAARFQQQPTDRLTTKDRAMGAAAALRSERSSNLVMDPEAISGKGQPIPDSELKPLAMGKEPKLKADEAIRASASKTLSERRASAARRLAVRGGGEDRRQALVNALKERKAPGVKLRSVGGAAGLLMSAPSTISKGLELRKAIKAKGKKPTLGEGMRMLLNLPQEEEALTKGKKIY